MVVCVRTRDLRAWIPGESTLVNSGTSPANGYGVRYILFLICIVVATACGGPTAPTVPLDQPFTLAVGESAAVDNQLVVEFTGVSGDSRCPADAVCIQGGDAVVNLRVVSGGTEVYELHTGDAARGTVTHRSFRISLVDLQPYPFSSRTIAQNEYRATLRVSRQ